MRQSRRAARLFTETSTEGASLPLTEGEAHYVSNVLRLRVGDSVVAFNGRGQEWRTTIETLNRRRAVLKIIESISPRAESALKLTLVQALVKSEAMDSIVQKATELGVTTIRPAITDFSVVRLDEARLARRLGHWQRIARSACEQSGRHTPPEILPPAGLATCLGAGATSDVTILLDPSAEMQASLPTRATSAFVVVGPEGGFGPGDAAVLETVRCERLRLGNRVLRADTAAITICALAQQRWGDLR